LKKKLLHKNDFETTLSSSSSSLFWRKREREREREKERERERESSLLFAGVKFREEIR